MNFSFCVFIFTYDFMFSGIMIEGLNATQIEAAVEAVCSYIPSVTSEVRDYY